MTRQYDAATQYINRELSWLEYAARVLELAADPAVPLLERVKFCAIFSQMLDEFFQVRVAGLEGQASAGVPVRSPDGRSPQQALGEIRSRVSELVTRQGRLWSRELRPALEEERIIVGGVEDCTPKELEELAARFEREIYPVLTPLAVGPGQPFPYISPLSLSLAVFVRDPDSGEERFARVKVPEGLPRFSTVGRRGLYVPLERVISHFLSELFPQMEIVERAVFRVTRDADFEVSDEADDLLEAVELELRRRRFGDVVRLEVSSQMSSAMLGRLKDGLDADDSHVYQVSGPLDLSELLQLIRVDRPELADEPWIGVTPPRFAAALAGGDVFSEIRRGDQLVHHPYDSFSTTFEAFVRAAASDPDVVSVKTTVYRTSDESPLVPALIEAAENGKQSVCLVELKARFDERRNIEWSRKLERVGVHVVYGFPTLKIHLKTTLVVRREGDTLRRYVHIGTGNYHAINARIYEDFGLFTADDDITADVADLFNHLTGFGKPQAFRKILVAPFNLRERLIEEIRKVASAAKAGKPGRIQIKVNALTDPAIIDELYEASRLGAQIDLIVRGICSLRPGVKGLSENIRVRSIVGRFLEHSRVYHFDCGGSGVCWLMGSADLMPRNLDNRLELVVPVENERLRARLSSVFAVLLGDNKNAWELGEDGGWRRVRPGKGERARPTHDALIRVASRAPRRSAARRR
ncbi:MAG TPA: polyphosphate kinase 1 [Gaiellaceae bacterium]|nr:polyphosphate kinase 1 [Gaiellaceae bacterium]